MIDIPKQDNKATGAVYAYCLQNLSDEEIIKSFDSCKNNLLEDGKILIFTTCKLEWTPSFFINVLSEEKLRELLNKSGFKIDYITYVDESVIAIIASKN